MAPYLQLVLRDTLRRPCVIGSMAGRVGTLILARAIEEEALSKEILDAGRTPSQGSFPPAARSGPGPATPARVVLDCGL